MSKSAVKTRKSPAKRASKKSEEGVSPAPASPLSAAPWVREGCPKEEREPYARHLSQALFDRWIEYLGEQKPLLRAHGIDPSLDMEVFFRTWMTGGKGMNEARTRAKLKVSHPDPEKKEENPAPEKS